MLAAGLPGEVAQLLRAGDEARIEAYFARMREDLARRASPALLLALSSMVHTAILTTALRAGISAEEILPVLEAHRLVPPLETASALRALCSAAQETARRIAERGRVDNRRLCPAHRRLHRRALRGALALHLGRVRGLPHLPDAALPHL